MINLLTWPSYEGSSWEFAHPPRWWQFRIFLLGGLALSVVPSYFVFRLDGYFHAHEALRYPFVGGLIAIEILIICVLVYVVVRKTDPSESAHSDDPARPNKSLERTHER